MIEWVRQYCLSFPHATENVQWEDHLVFKIASKMFAVTNLEPAGPWLSFKCAPETVAELVERSGITPARYLARAQWVSIDGQDALTKAELKTLLRQAYDVVRAKLPKKVQAELI